jgi:hypothetical protein
LTQESQALGKLLVQRYEDKYKRKATAENFLNDFLLSHDDNVSHETVRNWLNGTFTPTFTRLVLLAKWLGFDLNDLDGIFTTNS